MPYSIAELAARVEGIIEGANNATINGVAALLEARPGDLSFLANPKYAAQVATTRASAVLVGKDWQGEHQAALIRVDNPDRAFALLAPLFAPATLEYAPGIHSTAIIGKDVTLGENAHIGPYAVIGDGCTVGAGSIVDSHVVLAAGCMLGEDCHLYPHVSVREHTRIGNRVVIHNGTVIGSDGYGYTITIDADGRPKAEKIPQLGVVEIADDVEIGANVTIDRARFGATRIGRGAKIDNLVQIAHNVQIGESTGVVAQVGISGSTRIGSGVMLWGQAGIAGHLEIGDGAQVLARSGVNKNIPAGATVIGAPAVERREAVKVFGIVRTVERLTARVKELEAKLDALRKTAET